MTPPSQPVHQSRNESATYLCLNGKFIKDSAFNPGWQNRSFRYGDGLFETIAMRKGKICFLQDHLERARQGSVSLGFEWQNSFPDRDGFEELLVTLATLNQMKDNARFRWQIWRDGSGNYAPETDQVSFIITVQSAKSPTLGSKRAGIFTGIPVTGSIISAYKTCNALPYILAAREAQTKGLEEMVLLSSGAEAIAEATASNLFWIKGKQLFTPDLNTGCVAGIMRNQVIRWCNTSGQELQTGMFSKEQFLAADCVFTTNSLGIHYLSEIDGQHFTVGHGLVERLFRELILK